MTQSLVKLCFSCTEYLAKRWNSPRHTPWSLLFLYLKFYFHLFIRSVTRQMRWISLQSSIIHLYCGTILFMAWIRFKQFSSKFVKADIFEKKDGGGLEYLKNVWEKYNIPARMQSRQQRNCNIVKLEIIRLPVRIFPKRSRAWSAYDECYPIIRSSFLLTSKSYRGSLVKFVTWPFCTFIVATCC